MGRKRTGTPQDTPQVTMYVTTEVTMEVAPFPISLIAFQNEKQLLIKPPFHENGNLCQRLKLLFCAVRADP